MTMREALWRILLVVLFIGLILAVADLLQVTLGVLLVVFAGVLFAIFLNGLSRWPARHTPLPYRWSYTLVVLLLLILMGAGFYYMGTQVAQQAAELRSQLGTATQQLTDRLSQYEWAQQYLPDTLTNSNADGGNSGSGGSNGNSGQANDGQGGNQQDTQKGPATSITNLLPEVWKGMQWLGWGLTGLLVIFFVGLYVAYDPDLYKTGLVKVIPRDRRPRTTEVLHTMHSALGYWIIGRLISMTIVGVLTAIALWWLKVPLPVTLAVLAALLTFIPNIGPVLAAIPQALLALKVGTDTALYVIIFNIALQTVESYLITPMVQRYEVTLPPAVTIFVQLLMAVIVGVIGIIMAAPLTVALMVLVQMLYIHDQLGDPDPGELVTDQ